MIGAAIGGAAGAIGAGMQGKDILVGGLCGAAVGFVAGGAGVLIGGVAEADY